MVFCRSVLIFPTGVDPDDEVTNELRVACLAGFPGPFCWGCSLSM